MTESNGFPDYEMEAYFDATQVPYGAAPVGWACGIREGPGEDDERLLWRPETRRHVVRVQVGRLPIILRPQTGGFIGGLLSHPRFSLLA